MKRRVVIGEHEWRTAELLKRVIERGPGALIETVVGRGYRFSGEREVISCPTT